MRIYFAGAESATNRRLLLEQGVEHVAVSFYGLRRKVKRPDRYDLADRFESSQAILVDGGGYSANKATASEDWVAYSRQYADFVERNVERLALVTEFDCLHLSREHVEAMRAEFYDLLDPNIFIPVWHPEHGFPALHDLAERYYRVAVPESALASSPGLLARLASLSRAGKVLLHGMGVSGQESLLAVPWDTVSSTSWQSSMRYGETVVWDGTRLRRYPAGMKKQARRRHRGLFVSKGFDPEKIAADDPQEVARLTIWSWLRLEEDVSRRRIVRTPREQVTGYEQDLEQASAEVVPVTVAGRPPAVRNSERARRNLPVLQFTSEENAEGQEETVASVPSQSLRACDNCFVASNCPAFDSGSTCAYDIPLEIRSKDQLMSLLQSLIEMQGQRVAFMRFAEEAMGGYADPNLSMELDRLFRLVESLKEIQDNSSTFKMQVEARAGAGVISALFGEKVGNAAAAYARPMDADAIVAQTLDVEPK